MPRAPQYDAVVIGGGFFGGYLALHLRRNRGWRVALLELDADLMQRASYTNQARVHNGYHYPRSILTGLRSRVNFPRFVKDFREAVTEDLEAYYAVARRFSNVTAAQFALFCERIHAPFGPAPKHIRDLFDPDRVEHVFRVREYAFDTAKLKGLLRIELDAAGVELHFNTEALSLAPREDGGVEVLCSSMGTNGRLSAGEVFNCTYARLNKIPDASGLPLIPVKHELAEIALMRVPQALEGIAITIMCGPFFSVMPFPARGLRSLYHVRYTLHGVWNDQPGARYVDPYEVHKSAIKGTNWIKMQRDAQRYVPCLAECEYAGSLWEVRTVLPRSENDDSRPILFVRNHGMDHVTSIVGAKIDNVYDMIEFEHFLRE